MRDFGIIFPLGLAQSPDTVDQAVACVRAWARLQIPDGAQPEVRELPPEPMLDGAPPRLLVAFTWEV